MRIDRYLRKYIFALSGISMFVASVGYGLDVKDGCQGEGCDCFNEYKEIVSGKKTKNFEIVTIRPFNIYKDLNTKSKLLGTYKPGTKVRPLAQKIVITEPGERRAKSDNKKLGIKKGDKLDSELNLGEGSLSARHNGKWITYDYKSLQTDEIKKSDLQDWIQVSVGNLTGFTPDHPFEGCLE